MKRLLLLLVLVCSGCYDRSDAKKVAARVEANYGTVCGRDLDVWCAIPGVWSGDSECTIVSPPDGVRHTMACTVSGRCWYVETTE